MAADPFMERVLELAAANARSGGWPFAAVIVRDGKALAEGVNSVHVSHDPSDHAEISAIRRATAALGTCDLSGATIYVVGLPCPMCLTCIILSRISAIAYAVDIHAKDAALTKLPPTDGLYRLIGNAYGQSAIKYLHLDGYSNQGTRVFKAWNDQVRP